MVPKIRLIAFVSLASILFVPLIPAQDKSKYPSADEVRALLQKEPITDASWPAWKNRLTDWFGDQTRQTDDAYKEAARYIGRQADASGGLGQRFERDYLAYYMLGWFYLERKPAQPDDLPLAEKAYRKTISMAPDFARGYRNLALVLALQSQPPGAKSKIPPPTIRGLLLPLDEAEKNLDMAAKLDSSLVLDGYRGVIAQRRGDNTVAMRHFKEAMRKEPLNPSWATQMVQCILGDETIKDKSSKIEPIVARYPNDGMLAVLYGVGLALDDRARDAYEQFQHARALGTDPHEFLPADIVRTIEDAGRPGYTDLYLKTMMWFSLVYAVIIAVMATAGLLLALFTRGTGALALLQKQTPADLVQQGHIARVHGESILARLYGFALMIGLILFYAAIPFVIVGLLGGTALLIYLMFTSMNRIPIKLVVIIVVAGGFGAWAVFKSLFTRPASGGFGILKNREHCPRLYELLGEVASRVDTDPVNEVYLGPGAGIGVHQEGRGPFGMFGVNKRVLTLGFSTLRFLSVEELKAILAHEYAHFSHSDTFYSRFIYQVHMSIEEALWGMAGSSGWLTYVNPFYWFLWLYYRSYSLLAAGYSRSREFLADRMAASLYGAAPFTSALTKVSTDGTLFEMTMYDHVSNLLNEQKEFTNVYDAFAQIRNEQISGEERDKLYQKLLGESGSLFASHPTFAERAEAIRSFPPIVQTDDRPAVELFDNVQEIESELTRFLTDYMAYIRYLQIQAAQQQ